MGLLEMVYTGNEVHEAETKMHICTEASSFLSLLSFMGTWGSKCISYGSVEHLDFSVL